jgi:hypothetical protein
MKCEVMDSRLAAAKSPLYQQNQKNQDIKRVVDGSIDIIVTLSIYRVKERRERDSWLDRGGGLFDGKKDELLSYLSELWVE